MKIITTWMRLVAIVAVSSLIAPFASSEEIVLGDTNAPVTLIEYGSLTCGNCIKFHNYVLPRVKKRYIEEGDVRFIYRHFPTSDAATQGAVAAQCAGKRYYEMLDKLYSTVADWYKAENKNAIFAQQAALLGLDSKMFLSCLGEAKNLESVVNQQKAAKKDYDVVGTPTFVINEKVVRGNKSFVEMKTLINEAINKDS